jgi:hypothetical protein
MADKKVSELSAITNLSGDDLLLVVNDPSGTPTSSKVTISNLFANVVPDVVHKGTVVNRANTTFSGTKMTVSANLIYQGTEISKIIDKKISVTNAAIATSDLWDGITGTNTAVRLVIATNAATELSHLANTNAYIADQSDRITLVNSNLTGTNTAIRTLVDDRMQVANTNALVNDRMQVANVNSIETSLNLSIDDRMQVANVNSIETSLNLSIDDRMQVSNTTLLVNDRIQVANATALVNSYIANTEPRIQLLEDLNQIDDATVNSVSIAANTGLVLSGRYGDPASSNAATEGVDAGTVFYSNTHLYIATDSNTIKRIQLEAF